MSTSLRSWAVLSAIGLLGVAMGCSRAGETVEQAFPVMGTMASVRVPAAEGDSLALAVHVAQGVLHETAALVDADDPNGELARINQGATHLNTPLSRNMYRMLSLARHYAMLTDGAFDITITPVARLWGFGGAVPATVPTEELIRAARNGVGLQYMELPEDRVLRITSPYTRLSPHALAHGFAVDLAILELRGEGIDNVLVNLGGDTLRGLGRAGRKTPWTVALGSPPGVASPLGEVRLDAGQALAVTQLYDNYVAIRGHRYGHIINPLTGRPAEGTAAAYVLAPSATEADALATALVVLGPDAAGPVLTRFERCKALLIPDRSPTELWVWGGFEKHLSLHAEATVTLHQVPPPSARAPPEPGADDAATRSDGPTGGE